MNKELSGEHLLFTEQHKNIVLLYVNIFFISSLPDVLSLETEFVPSRGIALNLYAVWSSTLAAIPHYLPLE